MQFHQQLIIIICDQAREKVPLGAIINFYFIIPFYCPGNADHYGESLNHARPKVAQLQSLKDGVLQHLLLEKNAFEIITIIDFNFPCISVLRNQNGCSAVMWQSGYYDIRQVTTIYGTEAIATSLSPLIDPCYALRVWQTLQLHSSLYKLISLELQGVFLQNKYHKIAYTRYNCLVQKTNFPRSTHKLTISHYTR